MISTKNITFSYTKDQIFHMPDLYCEAGSTLLITGDSGKGKTTYLHILAGLLKPKSGTIEIDKTDIVSLSEKATDKFRGKHIGVVFQKSHFIGALTVLENLEMASWLATGKKHTKNAKKLLEQLGIENQASKLPSQLSIGQQQRVSIARALMNEPKVLLADEPTSSLDLENEKIVMDILKSFTEKGKTVIIVTHNQSLHDYFTDYISLEKL